MADHTIETIIRLRYDTYANWMNSNLILQKGEVALVSMGITLDITSADTPSTTGMKIGDGVHTFRELPWMQAIAADVYNWAKQVDKPIYNAEEIQGLQEYIEQYSSQTGGDGTVAPRLYRLIEGTGDNANKHFLQYKTSENADWITDTSHSIDLTYLAKLLTWIGTDDLITYRTLGNRTAQHIAYELGQLNYNDTPIDNQVVTAVSETKGKISVTRQSFNINNFTGILNVSKGGTGVNTLPDNQVLVGHGTNSITGLEIARVIDEDTKLVPNYLIKAYVDNKTAGLTGAMHYIGEATVVIDQEENRAVNPQIPNYDFSNASPGDVITSGRKEFVWSGSYWRLLGDEGSYAIKGSIVDADISPDAAIQQSKIANLSTSLFEKVDKIQGKQLSTEDYTSEEKNKLEGIQSGAQRNVIEHIVVNDIERQPITYNNLQNTVSLQIATFDDIYKNKLDHIEEYAQVNAIEHIFVNNEELSISSINGVTKSVNINFLPYTEAERIKLAAIEEGAQVNKIEVIKINNTTYFPDSNKEVSITIDQAALNLDVIAGAQVPGENGAENVNIINNAGIKKLELARIAKTGNIKDILQTNDEYVTLYCGTSTEII